MIRLELSIQFMWFLVFTLYQALFELKHLIVPCGSDFQAKTGEEGGTYTKSKSLFKNFIPTFFSNSFASDYITTLHWCSLCPSSFASSCLTSPSSDVTSHPCWLSGRHSGVWCAALWISVKSRSFPTVPVVRRKDELDRDGGWMQPSSWQTINYFWLQFFLVLAPFRRRADASSLPAPFSYSSLSCSLFFSIHGLALVILSTARCAEGIGTKRDWHLAAQMYQSGFILCFSLRFSVSECRKWSVYKFHIVATHPVTVSFLRIVVSLTRSKSRTDSKIQTHQGS